MKRSVYVQTTRYLPAFLFSLALLLCQYHPAFAESPSRPSILIISPFDRSLPFNARFISGLIEALKPYDLNTFDIFQENLDLDRNDSSEYLDSLAAFYNAKYASRNFDAIITLGSYAFDFLLGRCDPLSPGTPVVPVLSSTEKYPSEHPGRKIFPVLLVIDVRQTIDLILHLQPTLKKMYIVSGAHPYDRSFCDYVRKVTSQYKNGPEFVFLTEKRYDELLGAVAGLDAKDAILFLTYLRDGSGNVYSSQFVAGKLSETAGCPVYGNAETYMYSGIVGGSLRSFYRAGLSAGDILLSLLRIKNGAAPSETRLLPPRQVDERQMVRWGLSEKNLPAGFEVVNRFPSLWRDYRGYVAAALLFFFAQSFLISGLLIQRRSRRRAEQELCDTCKILEENQEDLIGARILQDRTLASLRESEATLQSILSSIPVGVLMIDVASRTVRKANRAAAELFGNPLEEMTGSPCPECFEPFITEEPDGTFQNGENSFEDKVRSRQGREVYVLKTVDRVILDGKAHLIGCLLDITQRKAAEREARERADQLVHADKMISLGSMAAGITHEIQNPNNFISLSAPVLKRSWEGILEKLDEYAEENGDFLIEKLPYSRVRIHIPELLNGIIEGAERIKNIVRDIKEFVSQKNSGRKERVDINAVLRSSLNLLVSKLNKSTSNLFVEYGENIPEVEANAQRLGQVAINLILNGAESLTDKEQPLNIRSYYEPERARVVMEVRDKGAGIKPEHLKRVFDPFFTTKRETGGTGLGLAISQKIVEAYGGRILITSTVGEGTTAVLEFPACSEDN